MGDNKDALECDPDPFVRAADKALNACRGYASEVRAAAKLARDARSDALREAIALAERMVLPPDDGDVRREAASETAHELAQRIRTLLTPPASEGPAARCTCRVGEGGARVPHPDNDDCPIHGQPASEGPAAAHCRDAWRGCCWQRGTCECPCAKCRQVVADRILADPPASEGPQEEKR
jgi:hypothetical protein